MELLTQDETDALCKDLARVRDEAPVVKAYAQLVAQVDREVERLTELHRSHLQCGPGCDACCHVERTVNTLEAYWIWRALEANRPPLPEPQADRCALLVNSLCAVYPARPILCWTHGLPLLVFDRGELGVTYCELNFPHLDAQGFEASEVLEMGPINAELLRLDQAFSQQVLRRSWNPRRRVALAELVRVYNRLSRANGSTAPEAR